MCWEVWKWRNKRFFEGKEESAWRAATKSIISFKEVYKEKFQTRMKIKKAPSLIPNWPISYFDGASQMDGEQCGVGVVMKLQDDRVYKLGLGCGIGTNTTGELLSLWCLLFYATVKHLSFLHVVGDSKIIIDWLNEICRL